MKMRRGGGGGGVERGNGIPAPSSPVPPLVFLAFFTYQYLPLPERLEQARYWLPRNKKKPKPPRVVPSG